MATTPSRRRRASAPALAAAGALLLATCSEDPSSRDDAGPGLDGATDGTAAGDGPAGEAGGGDGGATGDGGAKPANAGSPLGTGLTGLSDWSAEWSFVDAFKASRAWISGTSSTWDDKRSFDLDGDGWIKSLKAGQIARTLLFWGLTGLYPKGKYVVLYEGKGTLEYWQAATKDASASKAGRDVIDVDPQKGGIGINITALDASAPLRKIRVIMPGGACSDDPFQWCQSGADCAAGSCKLFEQTYAQQIFHPTFLARIKRYRVLRFMDWMDTNNSKVSKWSDRPRVDDARWTTHGAPAEVMVELANRLQADPWFNIPHLADDTYVSQLAKLVQAKLSSKRKVYVEHSNEVWNSQFAQAGHAQQRGQALGLSTNAYQAQLYYHAKRSLELFKLWRAAFGAQQARVVRVMGSQAASSWVSQQVLAYQGAAKETDALAIAPYIGGYLGGPSEKAKVQAMSVTALLTEVETVALPKSLKWIKDQAAVASQYKVDLVAYEGGQHLVGTGGVENDATINKLFDAANQHQQMGVIYGKYLTGWKQAGGKLFVHFVNCAQPSKWGRWGALEYLEQKRADAPKFDALQTFIDKTPSWW
jgi:hypothetical protein